MRHTFLAFTFVIMIPALVWAQDIPAHMMIGGDVALNINFFYTHRVLTTAKELPDFEQEFLGSMQGTSVVGSAVVDLPVGTNQFVDLHATLEEIDLEKEGQIHIPCTMYTAGREKAGTSIATANQTQKIAFTYLTLGADFLRMFGDGYASLGSAIGPAIKSGYNFSSHILEPDSCWYNYFGNSRSKTLHEESEISDLSFRIPITFRIGILIPFADRTYLAPSIGVNLGLFPINESASTVTSIQPGMGIRYMP